MVSTPRPSRRLLPASVLAAVVLVLFVLIALAARSGLHGPILSPKAPPETQTVKKTIPVGALGSGWGKVSLGHWFGWAALGLVAAFLLVLILRHLPEIRFARGGAGEAEADENAAEFDHAPVVGDEQTRARQAALRDAVLRSLEEIRNDPDARRAIIGAYRLMEASLARSGLPRAPVEAPREYLGRALTTLQVGPAAPRRLTVLFERARFDDAELDLSLRDEAIDALLELERAL